MTEHRILGNVCIKCDEPFTPEHPLADPPTAMGLNVLGGGKLEVGPVHKDVKRCEETALRKAARKSSDR